MYDLVQDIVAALKATPDTLTGLVSEISENQARSAKGGDENWSVVEVICHLRDAEEISLQRTISMRDRDNTPIIGYNQETLAQERDYANASLQEALQGFIAFRKQHLSVLTRLTPEQWQRSGQHNEIGRITIFEMSFHKASHDAVHCAQIARQLTEN
jgi:hypothetical protein